MEREKYNRKVAIFWSDQLILQFSDYFNNVKAKPIRLKVNERNKPLSVTDQSSRVINHWENSGLIDVDLREEGKGWRRYSAIDAIWINIIVELRKFGVSIDNIRKIKEQLTEGNEKYMPSVYPVLEFYTSLFMLNKEETYVLIPDDFKVQIGTQSQIELSKSIGGIGNHISISLHNIIKTVFKKYDLKLKRDEKLELSEEEATLLDEIRTGTYNSIEVRMKDGKIYQLNKEVIHSETQIHKLLQDKNYSDITLKKENGKIVHAQEIIKQRL